MIFISFYEYIFDQKLFLRLHIITVDLYMCDDFIEKSVSISGQIFFSTKMMQFCATIVCFLGFLCFVYNVPTAQDEWKNLKKTYGIRAQPMRITRRYCKDLRDYKSLCAMVTMNVRKDYMRLRMDSEIGFPELSEFTLPEIEKGYCIYCEYEECTFDIDRQYNEGKCFEGKAVLPLVKCKKSQRTVKEDKNMTVPYNVCQIR